MAKAPPLPKFSTTKIITWKYNKDESLNTGYCFYVTEGLDILTHLVILPISQ